MDRRRVRIASGSYSGVNRALGNPQKRRCAVGITEMHPVVAVPGDAMGGRQHHVAIEHHGRTETAIGSEHHQAGMRERPRFRLTADDRDRRWRGAGPGTEEKHHEQSTQHDRPFKVKRNST